jgi:hypothetical protein
MIKISLDEGYVFDILSILQIKMSKTSPDNLQKISSSFWSMKEEILKEIGQENFQKIISSQEYDDLLQANLLTFNLVDEVKHDDGLAKQVDKANYQRYLCKTNLQKKFFNNQVSEVKIGY